FELNDDGTSSEDERTPALRHGWEGEPGDSPSIEYEVDLRENLHLYRWTGAEAKSESEAYLPARPDGCGACAETLIVEGASAGERRMPGLEPRAGPRGQLTAQGQCGRSRRLWRPAARDGPGAPRSEEQGGAEGTG